MFTIEFPLDLGDISRRDSVVCGTVSESIAGHLNARVISVQVDFGQRKTLEVVHLLERAALVDIEGALCEKYVMIRDKYKHRPEDWPRDEGA